MICKYCHNEIDDALNVCPYCSQPVEAEPQMEGQWVNANEQANPYGYIPQQETPKQNGYYNQGYQQGGQQGYYQQPQYQQPPYQQYPPQNNYNMHPVNIKRDLDDAKLLGILSIVLGAFVSSIIGIICGAIGGSKVGKIAPMYPYDKNVISAKKLNSWGIGVSIARIVFCVLIFIALILAYSFGTSYMGVPDFF